MKPVYQSFDELAVVIDEFKKAIRESKLFTVLAQISSWLDALFKMKHDNGAGREG